ncbi:MAG: hypothetical protein N2037_12855, partial [Acidimicrobiales bacterium]|nr:hypothetical protein [Acidimicrobiales bacterium]
PSPPAGPKIGEPQPPAPGASTADEPASHGTTPPAFPKPAPGASTADEPAPHGTTPPGLSASIWTIAPGEHLWHVSATTLARAWSRPPTNAEIASYLNQLIRLNADRFVVPGEPDLVYPGQVFVLPPVGH